MLNAKVADLLLHIEAELRRLGLWQSERPSDEALASTQPFCIDTLSFPQWIQFVFLEKMAALIEQGQPLPGQCGIAPLAEEYFKSRPENARDLQQLFLRLDLLLSGGEP